MGGLAGPGGVGWGGGGLWGRGSVVRGVEYGVGLLSEGARISLPYLSVAGAARGRGARPQIAVKARERAVDGGEGAARTMGRVLPYGESSSAPDVHTQLEALLDQVWRSEAGWRLEDRIDLAIRRGGA